MNPETPTPNQNDMKVPNLDRFTKSSYDQFMDKAKEKMVDFPTRRDYFIIADAVIQETSYKI